MNINPNFQMLKLPVTVSMQRENNPRAIMADNNGDTFVHSAPSFKGAEQELLKKHPELATIIGAAVGVAVAKVVEMLGLNESAKDNKEYVYTSTVTDKCEDTYSYYADNTLADTDNKNEATDNQPKTEKNTNNDRQNNVVQFVFPKKGCRLKTNETKLRTLTENMSMPADYAERLQNVCKKLFGKENYMIEDKVLSATDITTLLYNELVDNKDDLDSVKSIIDKYNSYLETPVEEKPNTVKDKEESTSQTGGPKIVGKVNLDNYDQYSRFQRPIIPTEQVNGKTSYNFVIPGTVSSTQWALGTLFRNVANKIKESNPENKIVYFTQKANIIKAKETDVVNEIVKRRQKGNPYIHIDENNAAEIADILSSGKFKDLFSLHSSMRFIDKFVNFEDREKSIEEQCDVLIEKLDTAIKRTLEKGANVQILEQKQKQRFNNSVEKIKYVPTIIIEPEKLDKDIQNALGTLPIKVMFCKVFHPENNHKGIICTIFPLDVDYSLDDEM